MQTITIDKKKLNTVLKFIPNKQRLWLKEYLEGNNFQKNIICSIVDTFYNVIINAPDLRETDSIYYKDVRPCLHLFGGSVDIYITEISKEDSNICFGYTSLGVGCLEAGEICLDYVFSSIPYLELDFNFTLETIGYYMKKIEG